MHHGFYFDNVRCTGCKTCVLACKDYKDLEADRTYRRVIDYENGTWKQTDEGYVLSDCLVYHISLACNHCSSPECVHVCPTGAMHADELGLVWPDETRCIGCGYCTMACPYHAPVIDQETRKSSKCDGCKNRVLEDKLPICIEACPLRALDFGEVTDLKKKYPDTVATILPLADPNYTNPNLFIRASDAANLAKEVGGHIANHDEI